MVRKIVWSKKANSDRKSIYKYWNKRNRSTVYSKKLNKLFISAAEFVAINPHTGRTTSKENIHIKFVSHYAIIYEAIDSELRVHAVFDTRQNPQKMDTIINE